jgi:peptide/nickel transport system ATP-binding protein
VFDACASVAPALVPPAVPGDTGDRTVACLRHDPAAVAAAGFTPQPVPPQLAL